MSGEELNWQEKELQVKQELLSSLQTQIQDIRQPESARECAHTAGLHVLL
jgi:hypothetical protein